MSERVEARGSVQLSWPIGRPKRPEQVVERAIEAIEALRPAFRPTLFQINLRLRGSDDLPGRWLWSLEERGFEDAEDGEAEGDGEVVFRVADRVDPGGMRGLAREALGDRGEVDISSISVEVRSERSGALPIEMEIWALSELSIDMDWPIGDGSEPPAEIDRAVARLVALGWQVDEDPEDLALVAEEEEELELPRGQRPVALQLVWTMAQPTGPLAGAMLAIDAVSGLSSVAPPASAQIEVAFADLARVRPDQFHFSVERREGSARGLEIDAIRRLAREALAPQRPAGLTGRLRGLREVDWVHIRVALRDDERPPDPVHLLFSRRPAVHLEVQLRAAAYSDPSSRGRDRVETAVAELTRFGWKRAPARP